MKIRITAQPVFHLPIPLSTIELLIKMSQHHYDSTCKQASLLGGFLYGWKSWAILAPGETEKPVRATWDQIDITMKIMENTAIFWAKDDRKALATISALSDDLHRTTDHWNRIREDWATEFDTTPRPAPHIPLRA